MSETIVLSCPTCDTRFVAPADKFVPNGRQVRCSNCRHTWFYGAADATEAVKAVEQEKVSAPKKGKDGAKIRQKLNEKHASSGNWLHTFLWAIAALLIALILAYLLREPLGRAIPALKPGLDRYANTIDTTAQRLAGQKEIAPTLSVSGARYDLKEYDGERAMLVEARLVNDTESEVDAPRLRVRIVDANKKPIHETFVPPEDLSEKILPGQSVPYFIRIPEPPQDFDSVMVEVEGQS